MPNSIRLHPKYGVNPTIPVCFWCGQEFNEVAMLGNAYKAEAPIRMVLNYNPCAKCAAGMATGITCIEVDDAKTLNRPGFTEDGAFAQIAPTGAYMVVKEESLDKMPFNKEHIDAMRAGRKAFIERAVFQSLFAEFLKGKENGSESSDAGVNVSAPEGNGG